MRCLRMDPGSIGANSAKAVLILEAKGVKGHSDSVLLRSTEDDAATIILEVVV